MSGHRVLLNVRPYKQQGCECALAAVASVANFFDPNIGLEDVREIYGSSGPEDGLHTGEQAMLFTKLGFKGIEIVTGDVNIVDFAWQGVSRKTMIFKLCKVRDRYRRIRRRSKDNQNCYEDAACLVRWLRKADPGSEIVIDNDFPKYIRRQLNAGRPLVAAVSWTSLFQQCKMKDDGSWDDIRGDDAHHAIAIRGYDDEGIFVVDSNYSNAATSRRKPSGYYKLSWEKFLISLPDGDLILV